MWGVNAPAPFMRLVFESCPHMVFQRDFLQWSHGVSCLRKNNFGNGFDVIPKELLFINLLKLEVQGTLIHKLVET